jgi:HAD superfamily hydrolase (TIGR01509 family)
MTSAGSAPLRGIIFDMDGVLVDSEPFICEAAMRMFEQTYGQVVRREDFAPFVGAGEDRFIGGVAEKYGVALSMPRDKFRTYEIYLDIIRGQLAPLPGAIDFITAVRSHGLKTAVATSADRVKMEGNLREIKLAPADFDAVITGDDVTGKKPDPEIFLLAASRLNLPPAECLVVEDAPNGIAAAKAAGCRCLGLTSSFNEQTLRDARADFVARDLADVSAEILSAMSSRGSHGDRGISE